MFDFLWYKYLQQGNQKQHSPTSEMALEFSGLCQDARLPKNKSNQIKTSKLLACAHNWAEVRTIKPLKNSLPAWF